eukprot:s1980_g2.t3
MGSNPLDQCAPMEGVCTEPAIPPPVDFPPGCFLPASSGRFFLDIFGYNNSPLLLAAQQLRVDTIVPSAKQRGMDILDDAIYEQWLRLAWGGWLAALWSAPRGVDLSQLAPCALDEVHSRSRFLLAAAHARGATVGWDDSPAAFLNPDNAAMICSWNATCCNVAACSWGLDLQFDWLFCSNSADFAQLASECSCPHKHAAHNSLPGVAYPAGLALAIAKVLTQTCTGDGQLVQTHHLPLSRAGPTLAPIQTCDGAGIHSTADWSSTTAQDVFGELRERLWCLAQQQSMDRLIVEHIKQQADSNPLSSVQLAPFIQLTDHWFREQGISPCWSIDDGQSFRLNFLQCLACVTHDPDTSLLPALKVGVPTGVLQPLEPSGLWPRKANVDKIGEPLLVHHTNWQGAEEEPGLTQSLIDDEISNGWVQEVAGGLDEARSRWRHIAVGKLNVVKVPNKSPRLILDSSCCAVNQNCFLPECMVLPCVDDVRRSMSSSHDIGEFSALALDIHAAHKQVRLDPKEQGLVLFQFNNRTYHYKVAHFGGRFSAWWWQRLAAMLMRLLHKFLHSPHRGWIYVDDLLLLLRRTIFNKQATLAILFLLLINAPISWRKAQIGDHITWTGWDFNFLFDTVQLTRTKATKLLEHLEELLSHKQAKVKTLETTLGMLIWFTSIARYLRPHLAELYRCLHTPPATLYSIPAQFWTEFLSVLDAQACVRQISPSLSLPMGGRVVEYSHVPVSCKNDLPRVPFKSNLQWIRVQDMGANTITLTKDAHSHLKFFLALLSRSHHVFTLHVPVPMVVKAAADAYAHNETFGIGGWLITPSQIIWFSEEFEMSQLKVFLPKLTKDAQKYICAFEILAQLALLLAAFQVAKLKHLAITLPSASDNTAAESGINRFLSTRWPSSIFLEKLGALAFQHQLHLTVSHTPGHRNEWADDLSRGRTQRWLHYQRFRVSLQDVFSIGRHIHLHPPKDWPPYLLALAGGENSALAYLSAASFNFAFRLV